MERLEAFWAPGNVWLAQAFGLPLAAWSYPGLAGSGPQSAEQGEEG